MTRASAASENDSSSSSIAAWCFPLDFVSSLLRALSVDTVTCHCSLEVVYSQVIV